MYLVLLVFGAVLTAAGIVLTASGVSLHDHAFDASIVTPGIVAAVGGLLLVGLGYGLRVLRRIEQSLASRPASAMPRASRPGESAEPSLLSERPSERISPAVKPAPRLATPAVAAAAPPASEKRADDLPKRNSFASRFEVSRLVEETELSPKAPSLFASTSGDESVTEVDRARLARSSAARTTPRLDMSLRAPAVTERPAGPTFDALWPKGPNANPGYNPSPMRAAPPVPKPVEPVDEPEQDSEPALEAPQVIDTNGAVSVLKSGVVDGMAYTLYSDGSIEAELPQGTLRFGSITELRNHIEQSA
jgi:hypothetical protein